MSAADSGGGGFHGTLNNFAGTFGFLSNQNGLYFDGVDDYVDLPDITMGGAMTISAWVGYLGFNSNSKIFEMGNGLNSDNIFISNYETTLGSAVFYISTPSFKHDHLLDGLAPQILINHNWL